MSTKHGAAPFAGVLLMAIILRGVAAAAATPTQVRVADKPARVQASCCAPAGVLRELDPGTTLDVLRRDEGWYWVVLPADGHGTRKGGWVRVKDVEPVVAHAAVAPAAAASELPAGGDGSGEEPEDRVTITDARGETPVPATAASAPVFDDVHFDRNRSALRAEDMEVLRVAVAALKADPSLVVNIEGHTCNVGTAAYNLKLGERRAKAVKDYLVREGIAAERLHTVSFGEKDPKYDNTREATRKMNRRVAVVPQTKP